MTTQQFRQFADLLAEPALLVDSDGIILDINRAFRSSNLHRPEDVCGRRLRELVESDAAQVEAYLRACARRHDVVIGAMTFRQADGQPVRFGCQGGAICPRSDSQPAHLLIRLFPRGVSNVAFEAVNLHLAELEKQRYENALRISQQTLQTIFDQAGVGVALIESRSGRFLQTNQRFCDLVGNSPDEMTGTTWQQITHPSDLQANLDNMARLMGGEVREFAMEQRYIRKNGSIVWVHLTVSPTWSSGEQPGRHIAVVQDISDRKQAEDELRVAAATFKTHECIMITDEAGTILRVNERFTEVTGYTAAEAVGRNPRILKSGRHEQEFYGQMWTAIKDDGFWGGEIWNSRKDGEIFPQRLTITAVKNESNQTTHYVAIAQDITERKRAEQQLLVANESLRQSHAELERSNLELQQMTYAASHDLQEPLRSISSFSQLVGRRYRELLDDDGRSWLDAIARNSKRMQALIQDLRAYTELDAPSHSFEPTDLEKVLAAAIDNLHSSIRDSGAEVTGDQLPVIMGNPSQLVQLFQNLIGNAIKYRSEQTPKVHIAAEQSDETWLISVSDNGIGIEAKHHDAIFEIFRRLHHHHEQPGTGIGLAICRRVVQQHHGEISVESGPSQGSTFRFTIPIELHEVKV